MTISLRRRKLFTPVTTWSIFTTCQICLDVFLVSAWGQLVIQDQILTLALWLKSSQHLRLLALRSGADPTRAFVRTNLWSGCVRINLWSHSARCTATLSPNVTSHHAINPRPLCGANLVTYPADFRGNETRAVWGPYWDVPASGKNTSHLCRLRILGYYHRSVMPLEPSPPLAPLASFGRGRL